MNDGRVLELKAEARRQMKDRSCDDPTYLFWRGLLLGLEAANCESLTSQWAGQVLKASLGGKV